MSQASKRPAVGSVGQSRSGKGGRVGRVGGLGRACAQRSTVLVSTIVVLALCGAAHASTFDFSAITFNVGTLGALPHDEDLTDGYTSAEAMLSDQHYGNGLAWQAAIAAVRVFLATQSPDVVALQEVFDPEACPAIPASAWPGFICETWTPGDPSVVEQILGPGYQIACHVGKPDKCVAVRTDFGSIRGCMETLCLDGLDGVPVPGCGSGSRVGRARVDLNGGGELTVAHIHGTSGITSDDMLCREAQIEQLFQTFDGSPAADGLLNFVLGYFNTDPVQLLIFDSSAQRLTDFVGGGAPFDFVSDVDPPSYLDFVTLDHVISDSIPATCDVPGLTPGLSPVWETTYFDHKPIVCLPEPEFGLILLMGSGALLILVGRPTRAS